MIATILQTDIKWADPKANIANVETLMHAADRSNLYVLPEMWATGFCVKPHGIAEDEDKSLALQWMKDKAHQMDCAICGSLAVRLTDGSFRNRLYFISPDNCSFYDKRHLFTHGHENDYYTAGQQAVIVTWKDMRILLQTCYDLRFPCFSRYGRAGEYDAIIYVANWPQSRQLAWTTLTKARAIENQCYVLAANRVGSDTMCNYAGESAVIDPLGHLLTDSPLGEAVITKDIDPERLRQTRSRFRVLDDRDFLV